MKKNIIIAVILMSISLFAALSIAGLNSLTAPIIEKNESLKETKLCQEIFQEYDSVKSKEMLYINEEIIKRIEVFNSDNEFLGYIYKASGKNAYGTITLLIGIDSNKKLVSIKFMENGQSFATDVSKHVSDNYSAGKTDDDVESIDTKCGATYGAKLVKSLVIAAYNDACGGADNENK